MEDMLALLVLLMMLILVLWSSHTAGGCTDDAFVMLCARLRLRGLEVLLYATLF